MENDDGKNVSNSRKAEESNCKWTGYPPPLNFGTFAYTPCYFHIEMVFSGKTPLVGCFIRRNITTEVLAAKLPAHRGTRSCCTKIFSSSVKLPA